MPGSRDNKAPDGQGHDDLDDIQTLKNLLELRSFMKNEKNSPDEPLD